MPEQELAGGVEAAVAASTEQAERPIEDVAAQHAADMNAVQAEHGAEMSKEARCAQIGEALLTLATTDPDGEQYLAEYLEHTAFPDGTNECLLNFETEKRANNPAYDVTQEQPRRLAFVLRKGLQLYESEENAETSNIVADAAEGVETDTGEVADVESAVTNAEGKLVIGGAKDERGFQMLNAVLQTYKSVRGLDEDAILQQSEMSEVIEKWLVATRAAKLRSAEMSNAVLHWSDYRRLGLVDAAGAPVLSNVRKLAEFVFSSNGAPDFYAAAAWTQANLASQSTQKITTSNAAKGLLKKKRKQGKLNRRRGRR